MRVLIVDDEEGICQTLTRKLRVEGILSEFSLSAVEALHRHRAEPYPVIITDIRMPQMSGVEFIRELKKTHPTSIVFVMTGYASMEKLIDCLEYGAADFFAKPFDDLDLVIKSIREALDRHQRWIRTLVDAKSSVGDATG